MDPQQRLLLEVAFQALEDAHLPPARLSGKEVGVYVGASSLDHANLLASDPAAVDGYFLTGNTLSVLSNRISHAFDLKGPSFTVDTACSSALVALDRAARDLSSGRIETAIVAGVNMLLSPLAFIGFSRASMLSPTGLCRPFSAFADGYVRGEGAFCIVLQRSDAPAPVSPRAYIVRTDVSSDGRTSGIALPGLAAQTRLLHSIYEAAEIRPDDIAFIEAHGTGTRVGDPIEAAALGTALGVRRTMPLPIGSVKSNIGHLEPASGLAGLVKAIQALETGLLPATLHLDQLNPDIDFEGLNLKPVAQHLQLRPKDGVLRAGVSSFGFGGTNAHIILERAQVDAAAPAHSEKILMISAASREALGALAKSYAAAIEDGCPANALAGAAARGREPMRFRLAGLSADPELPAELRRVAAGTPAERLVEGQAPGEDGGICFVFSGNGAQWPGMARVALDTSVTFAAELEAACAAFRPHGVPPLRDMILSPEIKTILQDAAAVQPLLFAIQYALSEALRQEGLGPDSVVGHSSGEVAAATAAGVLSLEDGARIVMARVNCQQIIREAGLMATFAASRGFVDDLLRDLGRDDIDIAAENGPASVTVSGAGDAVKEALKLARKRHVAGKTLPLNYPFHSFLLEPAQQTFLDHLGKVRASAGACRLLSSVTGGIMDPDMLDVHHWWRNVREEVRFRSAVEAALAERTALFVEIGPRPVLTSAMADIIRERGAPARAIATFTQADDRHPKRDPVRWSCARARANGAAPQRQEGDCAPASRDLPLPMYPFQRSRFRLAPSPERIDLFGATAPHPLLGARLSESEAEWRGTLDPQTLPYLRDHRVEGVIVLPATALLEMAFAAARDLSPTGPVGIEDLDILHPMVFTDGDAREVRVRHADLASQITVWSRRRLSDGDYVLHAQCRIAPAAGASTPRLPQAPLIHADESEIYQQAASCGLDYGPAFRLASATRRDGKTLAAELKIAPLPVGAFSRPHLLNPAAADAAMHGLLPMVGLDARRRRAYLPIRIGRASLFQDNAVIASALVDLHGDDDALARASFTLKDEAGAIVARLDDILLKATTLSRSTGAAVFHIAGVPPLDEGARRHMRARISAHLAACDASLGEAELLLRSFAQAATLETIRPLLDPDGAIDPDAAARAGVIAPEALPLAHALLTELCAGGLARREGSGFLLAERSSFPPSERILATLLAESPEASADFVLAARAAAALPGFLLHGIPVTHDRATLENFSTNGLSFARTRAALSAAVAEAAEAAGRPIAFGLWESASEGLLAAVTPLVGSGRIELVLVGHEGGRLDALAARLSVPVRTLDLGDPDATRAARFDLLALNTWTDPDATEQALAALQPLAGTGAPLLCMYPGSDPAMTFLFGATRGWFARSLLPDFPIPTPLTRSDVVNVFDLTGWRAIAGSPDQAAGILLAESAPAVLDADLCETFVLTGEADTALGGMLKRLWTKPVPTDESATLVALLPPHKGDETELAKAAILRLRDLLADLRARPKAAHRPRLWLVMSGATHTPASALTAALWGFGRVAMNEYPDLDIRLADLDPTLSPKAAAPLLVAALRSPGGDREIRVTRSGAAGLRLREGLPPCTPRAVEALRLDAGAGGPDVFSWTESARRAPDRGEVEIAVEATGVNFRDVMVAAGLLHDDVLQAGFAGNSIGFECAGRVTRVGPGVTHLKPGDLVAGIGRNTFANFVTTSATLVFPVPEGLTAPTAASISVAFLTAWIALVERARLKRGERVLIHGGAGGVGLAAVQIARARGAHVIATCSTADKSATAAFFGAEAVLNSRSLDFADAIRERFGGVDVVLNSLSGEGMLASIKCLKPFGRFLELGKRDYVANTSLALRPFRRNLSYFGIDLDQIALHDPALVRKALGRISAGLADNSLSPLPIRTFDAGHVAGAFALMRRAGHVGKIVVTPPGLDTMVRPPAFHCESDGVQLVVGGTRGFGFGLAEWLVARGARALVLASRSGALDPALGARLEALREAGATVAIERADVRNAASVEALVERARALGPLTGVYQAAMVLDDALISNIGIDGLNAVLAPKLEGALHLDRATRDQPLRRFVMLGSAATLVGNPGQGAYAAANGGLEGLARRRHAEGWPALAVGFGPIMDTGVLHRQRMEGGGAHRALQAAGLTSADALDALGRLLAAPEGALDPVAYCLKPNSLALLRELPIGTGSLFADLGDSAVKPAAVADANLASLIAGKSKSEAAEVILQVLARMVAHILKVEAAAIEADRPLTELGLDSLMVLELKMQIEQQLECEVSVVTLSSAGTLREVSARLVRHVSGASDAEADLREHLVAMHEPQRAPTADASA